MTDKPKAPDAPEAPTNDTPAAADAPKAPKVEREKRNGQTKPAPGTKTGTLWAIIDEISAAKGEPATRKEVLERAEKDGYNTSMAASLYSHWRKFHGLVGTAAPGKAAKPETPAAPDAPAAPDVPPAPPAA